MSNAAEDGTDFGFERVSAREKTARVLHRWWKRFALTAAAPRNGQRVLDLAGGSGDLTRMHAQAVGLTGEVVLADINARMLEVGRDRLLNEGLVDNVRIVQANAEGLPFASRYFDLVTIAFGLRNVTHKERALSEMWRVLRPGGRLFVLEFSQVHHPLLARLYDAYSLKILPRLGRWVADDEASYRYLAESIRRHPPQAVLLEMLRHAGFERSGYYDLMAGVVAVHFGTRL
jgi:demethylmenaquinone methyltransferase / 2-methoxy-6-polyprenyl-1,4-benzoquinol methylase